MMIRDSEIWPLLVIIILCPILTEMIRVAGEELDNDSNEKKYGLEPSMNSRPPMVAKSKSEVEPSSRAIFLRPPTQLTQEDLELIEKRVEIKVNLYLAIILLCVLSCYSFLFMMPTKTSIKFLL